MKISKAYCAYEYEKFMHSFGFKGSCLTGAWQVAVAVCSEEECGIGLGIQSPLWSDSDVFAKYGEEKSSRLMYEITKFAVYAIKGVEKETPKEITNEIFEDCYKFAKKIVGMEITETFVLNALVPVDNALWMLWAREQGIKNFDSLYKGTGKADKLANIPLITYSTSIDEVVKMAQDGVCIFKIKLGADPDGDGNLDKMLEWDKARAKEIHNSLKDISTPYTESSKAVYYFDANGRYDTKERLCELLDFLDKENILPQTILFEEPFAPDNKIYVGDLPACFAADESAHSLKDVEERIKLGYKAITLKPIAKTLSVTIDMANTAQKFGVQCFCADLTVNPVMVEWNKNFASRLTPLKGMKIGVVESNGGQNYVNWKEMKTYLPINIENGDNETIYNLDEGFYNDGMIFEIPIHYTELIKKQNNLSELI